MSKLLGGFILGAIFALLTHHVDFAGSFEATKNPFSSPATFSVSKELPINSDNTRTMVIIYRVNVDYSENIMRKDDATKKPVATLFNANGNVKYVGLSDGNYTMAHLTDDGLRWTALSRQLSVYKLGGEI